MVDLNTNKDYLALKDLAHNLQGNELSRQQFQKAMKQKNRIIKSKKQFLKPASQINFSTCETYKALNISAFLFDLYF